VKGEGTPSQTPSNSEISRLNCPEGCAESRTQLQRLMPSAGRKFFKTILRTVP
jgi:hypothetical protein